MNSATNDILPERKIIKGSQDIGLKDSLQKNLEYFQKEKAIFGLDGSAIQKLNNPPREWITNARQVLASKNFSIQKNDIWYHSRRDPTREAKRILADESFKEKSHLILIGSGLGYLIEEVLAQKRVHSVLLIEPDLEMLFYVLARTEWSQTSSSRFHILFTNNSWDENFELLLPYLRGKDTSSMCVYVHPSSLHALPEMYAPLQKRFKDLLYKRKVNQSTIIKFQKIWNKNIILNLREIIGGSTLKNLLRKPPPDSIVIVGAGPSLDQNLDTLRDHKDRIMIFAVDTSYIPLIKANIIPDIVFSSDPQWINHHYVLSKIVQRSLWVLDPVICPVIPRWLSKFKASILWWDNPFYLDEYIRSKSSRGKVAHGGSISTSVFDVAIMWGAKKIILLGQDLAFTNAMAHTKGSVLEELVYMKTNRYHTMEMHNRNQMKALPQMWIKTSDEQELTFTNAKLKVYIDWFENKALKTKNEKPDVRLIRADQKGAFLSGFENLSLDDFLSGLKNGKDMPNENISKNKIEMNDLLAHQKPDWVDQKIDKILKLREDIQRLSFIHRINKHLILKYKMYPKPHILKEIDKNDQKILDFREANQILSLNAQKIILDITESDLQEPIENSLRLYSSMEKTTRYMLYLLEKV